MFAKFYRANVLICLVGLLMFTGCAKHSSNFQVNMGELGHEDFSPLGFNNSSQDTNYEMKRLSNGMIIYKDHSRIKDIDAPDSSIRFGPSKLHFGK